VYPYWKACKVCSRPFPCPKAWQVQRKTICSLTCRAELLSQERAGKPLGRRAEYVRRSCPVCKTAVEVRAKQVAGNRKAYCSRSCRAKAHAAHLLPFCANSKGKKQPSKGLPGSRNPAWKGGVTYFRKHGNYGSTKYVRCPVGFLSMARKDGYVGEHRLLVARVLNRCLTRQEVVHHDDHDPTNNTLSNLMLFASNRDHKLYEHHGTPAPIWRG
jgi:hypothetical protein